MLVAMEIAYKCGAGCKPGMLSEVNVGNLHVAGHLQLVDLVDGMRAVSEIEQGLPVEEHLEAVAAATDGNLDKMEKQIYFVESSGVWHVWNVGRSHLLISPSHRKITNQKKMP